MAFYDALQCNRLDDGRLQLRHGPIDLIIEAFGSGSNSNSETETAYQQAEDCFTNILPELAAELDHLRTQSGANAYNFQGKVAVEMAAVACIYANDHFVTPMVAVAGAVADHVLNRLVSGRCLSKAYVNNGGDIAIYLNNQQSLTVGVCANPLDRTLISTAKIDQCSNIRGVATSGWRGRSHSLGIADSVTVLASTAAIADAAATLIANAIDLPDHPAVKRQVASELQPDSDLGERLVTVDVGYLSDDDIHRAIKPGLNLARKMIDAGQITGVYGSLHSQTFSLCPLGFESSNNQLNVEQLREELACA